MSKIIEKNPLAPLPEILFGSRDTARSNQLSRWLKQGRIRKLAPRIYSSNLTDSPEQIMRRNLFTIIGRLFPGAVLSHRSALECKPTESGQIFLTYKYTKSHLLPGVTLRFMEGSGPLEGDHLFTEGLYLAQKERALLECLQSSRQQGAESKTPSIEIVEAQLESILRIQGEDALNSFRDRARTVASSMDNTASFEKLNRIISALLSTKPAAGLASPQALAWALGMPYDPDRLTVFERLFRSLSQEIFPDRMDQNAAAPAFQHFAFFEAYFSNYIEGTEFELTEAIQIIESGQPVPLRVEDSHDILGTYALVSDQAQMQKVPANPDELISLLQQRHAILLRARYDKQPGVFKQKNNRAGETFFVDFQLVKGTLAKGFEYYRALSSPFARAAFMMFLVSEVHPFLDGNGRLARVMMNAELAYANQCRIIIPTVYRDDYLGALRKLTRQQDPDPYIRMLARAQAFSDTVVGPDRTNMEIKLIQSDAFKEHTEGKLKIIP